MHNLRLETSHQVLVVSTEKAIHTDNYVINPIITEILQRITHPIARQMAEDCNERNRKDGFTMYKVDGEYCFEGLRVGPKVKIPSKEVLLALLEDQPINAASIRNITYTLIREELARLYGTSVQEAADIIGNQLDCAPHEDISGYILWYPIGHINGSVIMAMCQEC